MLPTFLIVGAARSGTTSLYEYCAEHPEVFMSRMKETNFFSSNPYGFTRRSYERLFDRCNGARAVGEASPSYLYDASAPYAIKTALPDCKIVVILRNPVDRLISDFFYSQSWGTNLDIDFSSFVTACLNGEGAGRQGFVPDLMVSKGLYGDQIRRYLEVFPRERLFIRLYEDLKGSPKSLMSDLYEFLSVDSGFAPDLERAHNANAEPAIPLLSRVVRRSRLLEKKVIGPLLPSSLRGRVTETMLALNRRRRPKEQIRSAVCTQDRDRLSDFYRASIEDVQAQIGRDLQAWLS